MLTVARHVLCGLQGIRLCLVNLRTFRISSREAPRYFAKAINLGLCCLGFCSGRSLRQAVRAGTSGFFLASYDVVSDWRGFSEPLYSKLSQMVRHIVGEAAGEAADDLWRKEQLGAVGSSGLERGSAALFCILETVGTTRHYASRLDVETLGQAFQLVDDILDYWEDCHRDEANCFRGRTWRSHLRLLRMFADGSATAEMLRLGPVLRYAVAEARRRLPAVVCDASVERRSCPPPASRSLRAATPLGGMRGGPKRPWPTGGPSAVVRRRPFVRRPDRRGNRSDRVPAHDVVTPSESP